MMNFQVSAFGIPQKIALFRPQLDDLWKVHASGIDEQAFLQREVVSVMSTDSGHFLLVLNGDELATIRDLSRSENCDFLGVFDRSEIPAIIADHVSRLRPRQTKKSLFC